MNLYFLNECIFKVDFGTIHHKIYIVNLFLNPNETKSHRHRHRQRDTKGGAGCKQEGVSRNGMRTGDSKGVTMIELHCVHA